MDVDEQAFVWALNHARHDPAGWAAARGLDQRVGGDGRAVDLADVPPRPPLAASGLLAASARGHAEEMAAHDYFGHESPLDGRWPNDLVRDAGYPLPLVLPTSDGLSWPLDPGANNVESIAAGFPDALAVLDALLVDADVDPPMHRNHLLGTDAFFASHREIGAGTAAGGSYGAYWTIHTGLVSPDDRFVGGVVWDDRDGDGAYDAGEGLPDIEVSVGGERTWTSSAGGWAIAVRDGEYEILCHGPGFLGLATTTVQVAGASREVDFQSGYPGAFVDFSPVDAPPPFGCDSAASSRAGGWLALALAFLRRRYRA